MCSQIQGMKVAHEQIGAPKIWRNDRFWIAGDHVVDPRVLDNAKVQALIKDSEQAKVDFKMTDYQGMTTLSCIQILLENELSQA